MTVATCDICGRSDDHQHGWDLEFLTVRAVRLPGLPAPVSGAVEVMIETPEGTIRLSRAVPLEGGGWEIQTDDPFELEELADPTDAELDFAGWIGWKGPFVA